VAKDQREQYAKRTLIILDEIKERAEKEFLKEETEPKGLKEKAKRLKAKAQGELSWKVFKQYIKIIIRKTPQEQTKKFIEDLIEMLNWIIEENED
jgi:hypothetical protein